MGRNPAEWLPATWWYSLRGGDKERKKERKKDERSQSFSILPLPCIIVNAK